MTSKQERAALRPVAIVGLLRAVRITWSRSGRAHGRWLRAPLTSVVTIGYTCRRTTHNSSGDIQCLPLQSQAGVVTHDRRASLPPSLYVLGVVLAAGGVRLVTLGGSFYYLIAGVALIASGVLLWRANPWGARFYALLTLGTIVWALAESGFDGWALAPRILPYLVLGLFLLAARRARGSQRRQPRSLLRTR